MFPFVSRPKSQGWKIDKKSNPNSRISALVCCVFVKMQPCNLKFNVSQVLFSHFFARFLLQIVCIFLSDIAALFSLLLTVLVECSQIIILVLFYANRSIIFHISILFLLASTLSPQHQLLCWSTPSQTSSLEVSPCTHP